MQKLSSTAIAAAAAGACATLIIIVIVFRMLLMELVLLLLLLFMAITVVMVMPVCFLLPYLSSGCTSECQLTKYEEISSVFTTLEYANILFDFYMAYACGVNIYDTASVSLRPCVCVYNVHTLYDFFSYKGGPSHHSLFK